MKLERVKSIRLWQKINYVLYIFIILFATLLIFSKFSLPPGFRLFTVQTGSMTPTIKKGSLIIIKSSSNYEVGEIITFKNPENPKENTTHRIIEKQEGTGEIIFTTKGDANNAPDSKKVSQNDVLGKVRMTLPYLGYPLSFAKTLEGLILFVILPALIIIYDEIFQIHKEWLNIKKARKQKRS